LKATNVQLADLWKRVTRRLTLRKILVKNSLDGQRQPCYVYRPVSAGRSAPVLVAMHKWGETYRDFDGEMFELAKRAGWIFLAVNYRGPNTRAEACGSAVAQQDVIDALDLVVAELGGDRTSAFLFGLSGGGHMALLLASHFGERFRAVSVWSPISDMSAWHRFHDGRPGFYSYSGALESLTGGRPGSSPAVDAEYQARSPITHLHNVQGLPIDINHGIHDGHTIHTIPIEHSIWAYNILARQNGKAGVADDELARLMKAGASNDMTGLPVIHDAAYGTPIYFREEAGPARLTIFEGAHDSIASAAWSWFQRYSKGD
jgi:dipeptidyl aminopeptidase/acylaminoacyl peptidase